MTHPKVLLWYRRDLRLHDHQPLQTALQQQSQIFPVYCFDPREFGQTPWNFPKTGDFRSQFLRESVQDLRQSWQKLGSNLIVRQGKPEEIIPQLCQQWQLNAVYWHQEVTSEETGVESRLKKALEQRNIAIKAFWGTTLHDPAELPFSIPQVPEVFTQFRKTVEKYAKIAQPLPTPSGLPALPDEVEIGAIPTLEGLG
ncbi:MAG: deoxyribodipyrimidine photo-lyase, partial [Limnothrix sp.]